MVLAAAMVLLQRRRRRRLQLRRPCCASHLLFSTRAALTVRYGWTRQPMESRHSIPITISSYVTCVIATPGGSTRRGPSVSSMAKARNLGLETETVSKTSDFPMDNSLGILRIRVRRGINLAIRDTLSSDPYVVISMGEQKLKTCVVKRNCNPEWNDELTISIEDPNVPIILTVYDKDTFTGDDKMGDAEIDIKPYLECLKMGLENLENGTRINTVKPNRNNYLADESCIFWNNGKIIQDMILRLRNVESGEVEVQIEWIDVPGSKHLKR